MTQDVHPLGHGHSIEEEADVARYVMRRVILLPVILLGLTLITFSLMYIIPGDPAELIAGPQATLEDIEVLREELGLNRPPVVRYLDYLWDILHLDLGTSTSTKEPVIREIATRLPNTLALAGIAMLVAILGGVATGMIAALYHQKWIDNIVMLVSLVGVSMPVYWLGLMLMLVFAVQLNWLPAAGRGDWRYMVLPALTLAARATGEISRMCRADMLEVLQEDYLRTARAKGLSERVIIGVHALKNALVPTVTIIGLRFGGLLGGAVLAETIFNWPGVGRLMVNGIMTRDFPVVQGCILVIALNFVLVNLAVDMAYAVLDPRIRYS